jgi:hypothetical protein
VNQVKLFILVNCCFSARCFADAEDVTGRTEVIIIQNRFNIFPESVVFGNQQGTSCAEAKAAMQKRERYLGFAGLLLAGSNMMLSF